MPNWHFSLCAFPVGLLPAGVAAELGIAAAGSERLSAASAYSVRSCLLTELSSVEPCACLGLAILPVVLLGVKHPPAAGADDPANGLHIPCLTRNLLIIGFLQCFLPSRLQFFIFHY